MHTYIHMHKHITHTKAEEEDGGEGNGHDIAAEGTNSQKSHFTVTSYSKHTGAQTSENFIGLQRRSLCWCSRKDKQYWRS